MTLSLQSLLPIVLLIQGTIGAIDTLLNHEWKERLPHRADAHAEIGLHALRESIYASLFAGLAWFEWHGALAWVIVLLLAGEVIVTATDEFIENHIRILPHNERVLHVFLTLNFGLLIALLAPQLLAWSQASTALVARDFGWLSWLLSALALAAAAWAVRDALAWRNLRRIAQSTAV